MRAKLPDNERRTLLECEKQRVTFYMEYEHVILKNGL